VIELGDVTTMPAATAAAPVEPLPVRKIALALVAALCLFTVTGSARPALPLVRPLWRMPVLVNDATALTDDTVYLHRATPEGARLTAFDLATGAIRWSRTTGQVVGYVEAAPQAGLLLVAADRQSVPLPLGDPAQFAVSFTRATMALDAATGAELWTAPGEVQSVDGDTALMFDVDDKGRQVWLRRISLRDHQPIWSVDTAGAPTQIVATTAGLPAKILTASADGEIKIFRYGDGRLLRTARIPWTTPQPTADIWNDMTAVGDLLVVNRSTQDRVEATAYRLDTMAEVWRAPGVRSFVFDCGPVVCVTDNEGMIGYDAHSLRRLWSRPGVVSAQPAGPERLLIGESGEDSRQSLIDATTGAMVGRSIQGSPIGTGRSGGALLVLHSADSPPDRTSVTRWDPATGRRSLLGSMDKFFGYRCQAVPRFLTCSRGDSFEVTAVR
jgi:hypothetical protein